MHLLPLSFYFNSNKKYQKFKKVKNLENGEFDEKSAGNKKDVKFDFTSDMFYKKNLYLQPYVFYYRKRFSKNQTL